MPFIANNGKNERADLGPSVQAGPDWVKLGDLKFRFSEKGVEVSWRGEALLRVGLIVFDYLVGTLDDYTKSAIEVFGMRILNKLERRVER